MAYPNSDSGQMLIKDASIPGSSQTMQGRNLYYIRHWERSFPFKYFFESNFLREETTPGYLTVKGTACGSDLNLGVKRTIVLESESFKLEKTSKIAESNHQSSTVKPTTKPRP